MVESSRSGNLFKLGFVAMGENSTRLGNRRAGLLVPGLELGALLMEDKQAVR